MTWSREVRSARKQRLPADWPAIVRRVLARDHHICHVCRGPGADGVDHLVAGDDHGEHNLAAIHHHVEPRCHAIKSSAEGTAARRRLATQRRRPVEPPPGLIT